MLIGVGLTVFLFWRAAAPPPPLVNTSGFDPAIAEAIARARQKALIFPRSAAARGEMGMVLLAHEIRAEACQCFAQAAESAPRDPRWPYFLGIAQLVDNPMAAVTNLAQAVRLFPGTPPAPRLRLGDALLGLGRLDEAETQYRAVWQHNTNSPAAALGLAKLANTRDHPTEALAFLTLPVQQDPSTRKAASRLHLTLTQRMGRTNETAQILRRVSDMPNDLPLPDPVFAEIEKLQTGEKTWLDRGDEWIKNGRAEDAARLLEHAVAVYPKSDRAMFLLGRARLRLGDMAGAETILSRAVALAPDSVEVQMQLGVLRLSRGTPREAQPCFRAAIQTKPNLAEAWYNLGLSMRNDSQRSESIAAFREAIRLRPNLFEAYLGLALVLRGSGQSQEAEHELRRALDLQPPEPLRGKLLDQLKLVTQPGSR